LLKFDIFVLFLSLDDVWNLRLTERGWGERESEKDRHRETEKQRNRERHHVIDQFEIL
jgi:hypothetical protein